LAKEVAETWRVGCVGVGLQWWGK